MGGALKQSWIKVVEDLLVNEDDIVDAELEEETSDANREDADHERDEGKSKMSSGEDKRKQDNKRRRLQLLASERNSWTSFVKGVSTARPIDVSGIMRVLRALEFRPTTKECCTIDASVIVNAVQGEDKSLHDEDAETDRWRMMYEGM